MKKLTTFLILCAMLCAQFGHSQNKEIFPFLEEEIQKEEIIFCEDIILPDQDPEECNCGEESELDKNGLSKKVVKYLYADRWGNKYCNLKIAKKEIDDTPTIKSPSTDPTLPFCQAGYFKLFYNDPNNFISPSHREVICQVFADISVLIIPADPTSFVNFEINAINSPGSNYLAAATSYYTLPAGNPTNQIFASDVQNAINQIGNDQTEYDGYMIFNMNYSYSSSYTNPTGVDLYTVTLHEIMHALGFASLIGSTGESIALPLNDLYGPYDEFLSNNGTPLLTNTGGYFQFNAATNLTQGCLQTKFANANGQISPVLAPSSFYTGKSLSHFSNQCSNVPGQSYVMHPSIGYNEERRLLQEEVNVLCQMGYSLTNFYGTANLLVGGANPNLSSYVPCGAPPFLPANDVVLTTLTTCPTGNPSGIFIDLVVNDFIPVGSTYTIDDVGFVNGGQLNTFTLVPNGIQFIPLSPGYFTLKYRLLSAGIFSSYATIKIFVSSCTAPNCTPDICGGLINNSGFETATGCGGPFPDQPFGGAVISLNCWQTWSNSPDLYARCPSGSPKNVQGSYESWNLAPNDHYVYLGADQTYGIEGMQQLMNSSLQPGVQYTLSFRARDVLANIVSSEISFGFSSGSLPFAGFSVFNFGPNITQLTPAISINTVDWGYYSVNFTYSGPLNLSNIIIGNTSTNAYGFGIFIDDINLVPSSQFTAIDIPNTICLGDNLPDLFDYIGSASFGGTFSGTDVTPSGQTFEFNPTTLGQHEINYTYTDVLGCVSNIADYIDVIDPSTIVIPNAVNVANTTLTTADVVWTAYPALPAGGYYSIQYSVFDPTFNFNWIQGPTVPGNSNIANISGLVPGETYFVRVKAFLSPGGCGGNWSDIGIFSTEQPYCFNTSPDLSLSLYSGNSVQLSWTAVPGTAWYSFQKREVGTTPWISAGTVGGASITKNIGGFNPLVQYELRARAHCPDGVGGPFGYANTTGQTLVPCSQSFTLSTTYVAGNTIVISWASVPNAAYYQYRYKESSASTWTSAGTGNANSTSKTFINLQASTSYDFEARAFCSNGAAGVWSSKTASTTGLADCESTPTINPIATVNSTSITITWGTLTGVAWYEFQYRTDPLSPWVNSSGGGNITSKTFAGLNPGITYEFRMRCNCIYGYGSGWSSIVDFGPTMIIVNNPNNQKADPLVSKNKIEGELNFDFTLYPLPNDGHVFLQMTDIETKDMVVKVTDLSGKQIFKENIAFVSGQGEFEIRATSGTYLVQLINPINQQKVIRKLIIQK